MVLTVEAALQLPVFTRTAIRVVAGRAGLRREVRWVHPVEIPDIAPFLSGGEMLLTAGLGIGRTPAEQRRYIRDIADAGAAMLLVELSGRAFTTMPAALAEEAEAIGFPLVALDGEVPFVEVSAQIHELLADLRTSELAAFEQLNETFIKLLLASSDPISFAEALARRIGHPVVLEDANHSVIAYAGGTTRTDQLLKNWALHAKTRHLHDSDDPRCTRRAIALRGEQWGWLHVLHDDPLSTVEAYALNRTADSVAIALLGDRERGVRAAQRQSSLVNRLLLGDITGEQFLDRALRIGRDLRDRPLVIVLIDKGRTETDHTVETLLKPLRMPAILADIGEHVLAVVGLPRADALQRVRRHLDDHAVRAGVSRVTAADRLPEAIRQARTAASIAQAQPEPGLVSFDDLGVLRILASLPGSELDRYVQDELGPVLRHDAESANPLLPTLRTFLASDGNKSRAADELYVQRRTLYYRLDRLSTLLNRPLEAAECRQSLALAVRALDFLRAQERSQDHT